MRIIKKNRWRWIVIAATIVVMAGGLAVAVWYFYQSPQVKVANAVNALVHAPQLRLQGSLTFETISQTPAVNNKKTFHFDHQQTQEASKLETTLELPLSDGNIRVPLSVLSAEQHTYVQLRDVSVFKTLISQANPLDALRLLRQQLIFELVIKQQWLEVSDEASKDELLGSITVSPLEKCASTVLSNPKGAQQLVQAATKNAQSIRFAETPDQAGQVSFIVPLSAFAPLSAQACNAIQPTQPLSVQLWLDAKGETIQRFQLSFSDKQESATLTARPSFLLSASFEKPANSITQAEVREQYKQQQNDALFMEEIARYPHLQTILENLQALDAEHGL